MPLVVAGSHFPLLNLQHPAPLINLIGASSGLPYRRGASFFHRESILTRNSHIQEAQLGNLPISGAGGPFQKRSAQD